MSKALAVHHREKEPMLSPHEAAADLIQVIVGGGGVALSSEGDLLVVDFENTNESGLTLQLVQGLYSCSQVCQTNLLMHHSRTPLSLDQALSAPIISSIFSISHVASLSCGVDSRSVWLTMPRLDSCGVLSPPQSSCSPFLL
jgi:hypothetical protein